MKTTMKMHGTRTILTALLITPVVLCSCVGGYSYHIKKSSSQSVPKDPALAHNIGERYPDWPVPSACRGATVVMRVGEERKVVSEWGSPLKTGFLVPGLAIDNQAVARVRYGGGKNEGDVTLLAVAPGETRAWYVRAVGSGVARRPDSADPKRPADITIRVVP